jgi:hypothetical protein
MKPAGFGNPAVCCATFSRVSKIWFTAAGISVSDECWTIPSLPKIAPQILAVGVPVSSRRQSRQALAEPGLAVKDASFTRYFKVWRWIYSCIPRGREG